VPHTVELGVIGQKVQKCRTGVTKKATSDLTEEEKTLMWEGGGTCSFG